MYRTPHLLALLIITRPSKRLVGRHLGFGLKSWVLICIYKQEGEKGRMSVNETRIGGSVMLSFGDLTSVDFRLDRRLSLV